jgi:hypothetical protein
MCLHGLNGDDDDLEELADLRWHWDLAYEIDRSRDIWSARFLGGEGRLLACSAEELRSLIRADYALRKAAAATGGVQNGTPDDGICAGERALRRLLEEGVI